MTRRQALAAACLAVAVAVAAILAIAVRDDDEREAGPTRSPQTTAPTSPQTTAPTSVPTTAPTTAPTDTDPPPEEAPAAPAWGDFPGAPPPLEAPRGGESSLVPVPGGSELTVRRADGSTLAVATLDEASGAYLDARYFDRRGRLTLVVAGVRVRPGTPSGGFSGGARVRCGSAARVDAGFRWTAFPIVWRLNARPLPPRVSRAATLAAVRSARGVWNANRSHCRALPDRSRAGFRFAGTTTRRTGRDGRSVVEFGETDRLGGVCRGTIACTATWLVGPRAVESDVRVDRLRAGGFFTGARGSGLDLQSVMVHESGHSLGFDHVLSRDVVMFPFIARGTTGGRLLGRGDALASNAKY